jgi:hypothetical protein
MSSQVEDLTPEQRDALENLKSAVADVEELAGMDDRYFLRWLKARKFHLAKAEDMLRKVLATCIMGIMCDFLYFIISTLRRGRNTNWTRFSLTTSRMRYWRSIFLEVQWERTEMATQCGTTTSIMISKVYTIQ